MICEVWQRKQSKNIFWKATKKEEQPGRDWNERILYLHKYLARADKYLEFREYW